MTDAEAWSAFCAWQAADPDTRLLRIAYDADPDLGPAVRVTCSAGHEPPEPFRADTLAQCWEKFAVAEPVFGEAEAAE